MIGLEDAKVDRLANFMGHHKEIHKNIFRVDVPVAEMTLIAQLLKTAMSHDEDDNSSGSSSSDENEGEDDNNDEEIHDVIKTIQTSEKVVSDHKISRTRRNRCDDSDYESKNNVTMNKSDNKRKKIVCTTWTEGEKTAVFNEFGELSRLEKVPSISGCQKAINKNPVLGNRSAMKLRIFIDNERRKENRRKTNAKTKRKT
ncbi:uncharacterized protein LOC141535872 [Cotesia typhae]|uniref:uncharacterized protein LOC141535872 n=1 Tax=Cotesia typhae TaxID=2053667 RepID=UPI003D68B327